MGDVTQITAKLWRGPAQYFHWCPGCKRSHVLPDSWKFNGDLAAPTFNPSFKQTYSRRNGEKRVCHYFLHGGILKFCGDSMHALAGQNVPLPDIPEGRTIFDDFDEEC